MPMFKEAVLSGDPDRQKVMEALGTLIIDATKNFSTVFQPLVIDGELVYGVTSYGSDELMLVHDDDYYPLPDDTDKITALLPVGLRKAAALESQLHSENVRDYHLENVDTDTHKYFPKKPHKALRSSRRMEALSHTRAGRLWLRILDIFDK